MIAEDEGVYPGTVLLKRFCWGCEQLIPEIRDVWVDVDANCAVCQTCRDKAWDEGHYATYDEFIAAIVPARLLDHEMINEMDEG